MTTDLLQRLLDAITWLETQEGAGLINDDFGHWAVSTAGTQNLPKPENVGEPFDLDSTFWVEKDRFRDTILEAIELARDDPE